jgi:hypothetical protein
MGRGRGGGREGGEEIGRGRRDREGVKRKERIKGLEKD